MTLNTCIATSCDAGVLLKNQFRSCRLLEVMWRQLPSNFLERLTPESRRDDRATGSR